MNIELPDVNKIISEIIEVKAKSDETTQTIEKWVKDHRDDIKKNTELIKNRYDSNDLKILIIFLDSLLVRAMSGERGSKVKNELILSIKSKKDLNYKNYVQILNNADYRWGAEKGAPVIDGVVTYFRDELKWDWVIYFKNAEKNYRDNFQDDKLLKIKNVGYKLRDLALSNFNENYVANDLHVVRIMTRLGLLNYGFELLEDDKLEMGNNPSNENNYLFLHKLILRISELTGEKYSPSDLDRIFWHFGRTICKAKRMCKDCPVNALCLTSKHTHR
ncbi:MAG: hypothetical protein KKH41_01490 [Candidatus Thermoplasmatota archaeon]|nr:hypothetical protein [Euryarchaeota archaeon]MBU4031390.1 hypothetical protein [Candidatus Thermoplasmatota archaeon]MBU4072226.1 hypothetical protein [Candidatus Thermoplasmatota archaeon]MBU4145283.1 hypothetical protein [Candidatus Thermoplasmatota archaeon]MBU4591235.1 hypothetical protein [Candidatus Thermoplasmatota archaeon]